MDHQARQRTVRRLEPGLERILLSRDDLTLIPERELLAVKLRWTLRK